MVPLEKRATSQVADDERKEFIVRSVLSGQINVHELVASNTIRQILGHHDEKESMHENMNK